MEFSVVYRVMEKPVCSEGVPCFICSITHQYLREAEGRCSLSLSINTPVRRNAFVSPP